MAPSPGFALAWATVTLLPWFGAWEANKRFLRRLSGRTLRLSAFAAVMLLCLICTCLAEWLFLAPPGLGWRAMLSRHILAHIPEIGIVGLLTAFSLLQATGRTAPANARDDFRADWDQLIWAKAAGNYVELKIGNSVRIERMTLQQFETIVDPDRFARISRFVVVNRARVVGSPNGSWIRMSDGTQHRIGNAYRASLR